MSFSDLERGHGSGSRGSQASRVDELALASGEDKRFTALADRISLQIFRINSNVTGIHKLVETLGSKRDNHELRQRLHNLTEATKDLVKSSTDDVKQIANYDLSSQDSSTRQRKLKQAKISRDFQTAVLSYQSAAKASAERQRQHMDRAKAAIDYNDATGLSQQRQSMDGEDGGSQQLQMQDQIQTDRIADSELEFQEQVIQEREAEIRGIEAGVVELNEIFRDLGTIVTEQQSMLDNIESNVISIADDTQGASEELTSAHNYQRKAGRRALCLLLIFIVVLSIVLLAILS